MADHSLNAIRAAAKAVEEVILPALDPKHPLAREQAGLVARTLRLLEQRLEYAHARNRFELEQACDLGQALSAPPFDVSPALLQALSDAVQTGRGLLALPQARPSQLQAATTALGELVAALVRTTDAVRPQVLPQLERLVLERSSAWLDMQRAWFLPQGWEPAPDRIPPLDRII
jgi:hypothetical protein